MDGIDCYSGSDGLRDFLARTDVLVCLVPLTDDTRGLLNGELFAQLPRGAALVNVGRGGHLVEDDLLAALNDGQLSAAVLDVCETEPLPQGHPFWTIPTSCSRPISPA
jgi:glyoxylate/hydroxypyruvate reductase A